MIDTLQSQLKGYTNRWDIIWNLVLCEGIMGGFTDFEPDELWALAQLCKRIDGATLEALSANESESSDMLNGVIKLADLLAELGYKPR